MKDTIHTIRRSSHRFFSGTMLSRASGMLRDMSMAYAFGTQPSIAAFMVAFRFAHLLRRLFGEGALQSAFVPEFEALRHQSEQRAFTFFHSLTIVLSLFLTLLIALSCGIIGCCLWWGNFHPDNQEILVLTLIMLPSLLFICLFGLNASFLQCEKSYFVPGVAPVAFNGIWVITVLYLRGMSAEQAMPWLSFGVVIACLFQWLITVPKIWPHLKIAISVSSLWAMIRQSTPDLFLLGKPLLLGIVGVAASQINNAIDSLFARYADPEGPALLWYAIRIQQLPLALFGIAIAGAILPPLSRALKAGRQMEYRHFLQDALSRTLLFMLPLTATLFVMGDSSVNFLYGRGDFGTQSVIQTTYCLWAYGLGLLPSALVLILAPACYANSNYTLPAAASFTSMFLNLILNTLFISGLGWGAISVAVATSISAWVNLFILGWQLSNKQSSLLSWALMRNGLAMSIATLSASWGTYVMRSNFQQMPLFSSSLFSASFFQQLFFLSCQALTFGIILFPLFYLLSYLFERKHLNRALYEVDMNSDRP